MPRTSAPWNEATTRAVDRVGNAAQGAGHWTDESMANNDPTTPARPQYARTGRTEDGMRTSQGPAMATKAPTPSSHTRVNEEKYARFGSSVERNIAQPKEAATMTDIAPSSPHCRTHPIPLRRLRRVRAKISK